ncbi:hypothetical protein, partial [Kineococcus indalonis]|uniref:hypothetical protein n=1 Tax=Kineococcus indalonis TaxID=2696566 RepID=UPI001412337B
VVLALAAAGPPLALAARARPASAVPAAAAAALAALLVALAADTGLLALLGYLVAIVGPAAFLVVLAVGALRDRRSRPWLLGLLALLAAGAGAGVLRPAVVAELAGEIAGSRPGQVLPPALRALLLTGAALWALTAVLLRRAGTGRCGTCGRPGPRWGEPAAALRRGRVATLVAAACPLPYALLRATWLTPWPQGAPADLEPATRLFGLALGAAAVGGCVLTVGLLRPWGEVWPGWVPVLRGRPVPWRLPVLLAGAVAAVLLAATPAFLAVGVGGLREGDGARASFFVLFPTLPWGLALAAAAAAYGYRRRGACGTCGRGAGPLSVRDARARGPLSSVR